MDKTLREKANQLLTFLKNPEWLNFIGVGELHGNPCLYLYTNRKNIPRSNIPDTWQGIPITVRCIGRIKPA